MYADIRDSESWEKSQRNEESNFTGRTQMPLKGQPVLGQSLQFNFKKDENLGWTCHCGTSENLPILTSELRTIQRPVITNIIWNGSVRMLLIECLVCNCKGRVDTLHNVIDIEGLIPTP